MTNCDKKSKLQEILTFLVKQLFWGKKGFKHDKDFPIVKDRKTMQIFPRILGILEIFFQDLGDSDNLLLKKIESVGHQTYCKKWFQIPVTDTLHRHGLSH